MAGDWGLKAELVRSKGRLERIIEDEEEIRALAKKVLPIEVVNEDTACVPGSICLVEMLVELVLELQSCEVNPVMSRSCDVGTKGCVIQHKLRRSDAVPEGATKMAMEQELPLNPPEQGRRARPAFSGGAGD